LGALGNANLRVVITWNSFTQATNKAINANNNASLSKYDISNVELVYEELEFSAQDASNIMKESGGAFAINTIGIETHQKTLSAGITSDTTLIPVKVGQLKSLLTAYYDASNKVVERELPFAD
jgi:hypothetical protein